jgi:hypothetical protein
MPTPDTQEQSPFFRFPQEIRDEIYTELFSSTRISHGERALGGSKQRTIRTGPNALALIRACRRTRQEIGDRWLGLVHLSFEDLYSMLARLGGLPIATRAKIRHLRIRESLLDIADAYQSYELDVARSLDLLPGLQLRTLTVLSLAGEGRSYTNLDFLIGSSNGWQELRYISPDPSFLGFAEPISEPKRDPQPSTWVRAMQGRDGSATQPSVTIYRATAKGIRCPMLDLATCVTYEQPSVGENAAEQYGRSTDAFLASAAERVKEMMVVAVRGTGVDYQVKPHEGWQPIILPYTGAQPLSADRSSIVQLDDALDAYESVHDYEWNPEPIYPFLGFDTSPAIT